MSDIGGQPEWQAEGSGSEGGPEHAHEDPIAGGAQPDAVQTPHSGGAPRRRGWIVGPLALVVALAIALILVFVVFASSNGPNYSATYQSVTPDGPRVVFVVKNTGNATGTPTCVIRVVVSGGMVAVMSNRSLSSQLGPLIW